MSPDVVVIAEKRAPILSLKSLCVVAASAVPVPPSPVSKVRAVELQYWWSESAAAATRKPCTSP